MPKTWFVTFRPKDARLLPDGHRRTSKRFDSEADAKTFALDRLADSTADHCRDHQSICAQAVHWQRGYQDLAG
jgi:hypothetical protein